MRKELLSRRFFLSLFIFWQILFLFIPLMILIYKGIFNFNFINNLFWIFNSNFLSIIFRSFSVAFLTSCLSLIIGYIISYIIVQKSFITRSIFLFFMGIPFLTNFIIHLITWSNLLQSNGLIISFLKFFKIFGNDFHLLYTNYAVFLGYIYCFLPFMIFPIYNSLLKFDKVYFEASYDLGASFFKTFFRVVVPMTKQGIYTGFFLVLVSSAGEFIIPEILGGDKYMHCGTVFSNILLNCSLIEKGSLIGILFVLFLIFFCWMSYLFLKLTFSFLEKI